MLDLLTYKQRIEVIHRTLGIPESYATDYALPLHVEEQGLIEFGNDVFGRPLMLHSGLVNQWVEMEQSAKESNVDLYVVSAFRSLAYQASIIATKLEDGQKISDILTAIAAPGYSEHHTGRALDLTSTEIDPLSEKFDQTESFSWLLQNANAFGFKLSYPKNSKKKIMYEPWHWACL